jgi:glyceraldehyde-3-phosphate dehydrogenase (NADP+)
VHDAVYEPLVERLVAGAEGYRQGPKLDESTDMGPLIDEGAAQKVQRLVEDAVSRGARVLCGGEREGTYFAPTFLADVPDDARIGREEVYGPVTALYRFTDLDDAIDRANDVDFGLQAAIFTRDLDTAFAATDALRYGAVMVNDSTDYRIDAMPFGGFKGSGLGREGVAFALHEMTEPKLVCLNLQGR